MLSLSWSTVYQLCTFSFFVINILIYIPTILCTSGRSGAPEEDKKHTQKNKLVHCKSLHHVLHTFSVCLQAAPADIAPPVPPRSRRGSQSSVSDLQPTKSPIRKSHLLPPKTPRKSALPQLRSPKYPALAPKPGLATPTGSRSASESSGSEEGPGSGGSRPSGIPTINHSGNYSGSLSSSPSSTSASFSGLPSPRAGRPLRPNYSNVVIDLKNRQKKMADSTVSSRNSRGSTSGEDSETFEMAPPVPPRSPRD